MTEIAYKISTPTLAYISTESITLTDAVAAYTIEELERQYDRTRLEMDLRERFFVACKAKGMEKEGEDCWWMRKCVIDANNGDDYYEYLGRLQNSPAYPVLVDAQMLHVNVDTLPNYEEDKEGYIKSFFNTAFMRNLQKCKVEKYEVSLVPNLSDKIYNSFEDAYFSVRDTMPFSEGQHHSHFLNYVRLLKYDADFLESQKQYAPNLTAEMNPEAIWHVVQPQPPTSFRP